MSSRGFFAPNENGRSQTSGDPGKRQRNEIGRILPLCTRPLHTALCLRFRLEKIRPRLKRRCWQGTNRQGRIHPCACTDTLVTCSRLVCNQYEVLPLGTCCARNLSRSHWGATSGRKKEALSWDHIETCCLARQRQPQDEKKLSCSPPLSFLF